MQLNLPRTLAGRLVRSLLLRLALVWLFCVLAVAFSLNHELEENFDVELAQSAHRMFEVAMFKLEQAAPEVAAGQALPAQPLAADAPLFYDAPPVYQLVDARGTLLLRSQEAPLQTFAVPLTPGFHNRGAWRVHVVRHPQRALYFLLADPLSGRNHEWHEVLMVLLAAALVALALLAWALPGVATRELRVLDTLQRQIGQRGAGDLRAMELQGLPAELEAVGDDVNRLLERLAQALDVERTLAANAAHELRTPLAVAQLRLQTAFDAGVTDPHVRAAHDALRTLRERTEKLLQLSRAESGAALHQEPVSLADLASIVVQEFWHGEDAQRRLDLSLPEQPLPPALGDPDTLAIALRNLIENALKYSAGAAVEVVVQAPATLIVRDGGPGVPPQRLATLRERHVRHARGEAGYGLGLSITASIVARHAGTLTLLSPPPGQRQGFEARMELPLAHALPKP